VAGAVLAHHVHVGVGRDLAGDEPEHPVGAGEIVGQDQVPHQEPAPGEPVCVEHEVAHLRCISFTAAVFTSQ
jgi:hypothetical protein